LEPQRELFEALVVRRQDGEPIAYIIGIKEFWGLEFEVCPDVLIPRPESELIIEQALSFCAGLAAPMIADLGTGSGCLAIAVVHELIRRAKEPRCTAVDLSAAALQVAESNAKAHGVKQYITFVQSDWFSEQRISEQSYDLIIANPPYISRTESTPRELNFEPQPALFSDDEGLCDAKLIIQQSISRLKPAGCLLVEVGAGKRKALAAWLSSEALPYSWDFLGDDRECDSFTVVRLIKPRTC
jgi:release factor glutamine methyltransferase